MGLRISAGVVCLHLTTPLKKVCCYNTSSEFPNTPRCVAVRHLFTVLFHGSSNHTNMCKVTYEVCNNYTLNVCGVTHLINVVCNTR